MRKSMYEFSPKDNNLMKILISLLVISLFFVAPAYTQNSGVKDDWHNQDYFRRTTDPKVKELLDTVERYHFCTSGQCADKTNFWEWFGSNKYKLAIEELEYVLRIFPNHPTALNLMELMATLTKSPTLAVPWYGKALKSYPNYPIIHVQYGNYLININRIDAGMAELQQAIKIDPKFAMAYVYFARAYRKMGKSELADSNAKKAKELGFEGDIFEPDK
jgi:predicted Zn-dependent protease